MSCAVYRSTSSMPPSYGGAFPTPLSTCYNETTAEGALWHTSWLNFANQRLVLESRTRGRTESVLGTYESEHVAIEHGRIAWQSGKTAGSTDVMWWDCSCAGGAARQMAGRWRQRHRAGTRPHDELQWFR